MAAPKTLLTEFAIRVRIMKSRKNVVGFCLASLYRNELNSHVEKLLGLTSNYTQDEGCVITPAKLFQEFQEIWSLVSKIRALEDQFNMTRRLRESGRQVHLEAFLHWLIDTQGGKIKNLEVKDYGSDKGS